MLVLGCENVGGFFDSIAWLDENSPPVGLPPAFPNRFDPPDELDGAAVIAEFGAND